MLCDMSGDVTDADSGPGSHIVVGAAWGRHRDAATYASRNSAITSGRVARRAGT